MNTKQVTDAVTDAWALGDPYERYIGRWSRHVAPRFVEWLKLPQGLRWVDVGCGTGALSAAILHQGSPSSVIGIDPSSGFLDTARRLLGDRVSLYPGSATSLPLADASADVVASGLVLNFVADPLAALTEASRVAGPGGCVAAYAWDYAGKMELMRCFWDAAISLDAGAAQLDEGLRFALCEPPALTRLFAAAALQDVDVHAIEIATPFASFDDYWAPFLGGQGPAPAYAMSLDDDARARLRGRLEQGIPRAADGSIAMVARAWAVRGTVASGVRP